MYVTFSSSASEEVGDRGLMGLRDGELPALDTYSGSGTYRTCKRTHHQHHNTTQHNFTLHTPCRFYEQGGNISMLVIMHIQAIYILKVNILIRLGMHRNRY